MDSSQCLAAPPLLESHSSTSSHLHPVALRSTASSSPSVAAASKLVEVQLRDVPSETSSSSVCSEVKSASATSCENLHRCSALHARPGLLLNDVAGLTINNRGGHLSNSAVAGLQIDHQRYPLLSSIQTPQAEKPLSAGSTSPSIHLISCAEFVELHDNYITSISGVDESVVFPWLHCCSVQGTPQASYFSDSPHATSPPRYRGLTVVSADTVPVPRSATSHDLSLPAPVSPESKTHDRTRTRSLGASSTTSRTSLDSAATASSSSGHTSTESVATAPTSPSTSVVSFDGPEPRACLLRSSLLPQDILERCSRSGQYIGSFATPRLPPAVNLRLFRQQPSRYATISDVVVYSQTGLSDEAIALAQLIREAQAQCFSQRGGRAAGAINYNVYIVSEPFEVFERDFSHVVAVDSWGYRCNKIDFFEREREEMAAFTSASEISANVYLGNSADVPLRIEHTNLSLQRSFSENKPASVTSHFTKVDECGSTPFNICIEAHDQAAITSSLQFHLHKKYLDCIAQRASSYPSESGIAEIIHMEVPSTGQSASGVSAKDKLIRYLVDFCIWVKKMTKPDDPSSHPPIKVLLHCHDGYTETSLFALSYVMYDRGCTLPEAYLYLQNEKNRSFFVYPADVQLLRRVECRIEQELHEQRKAHSYRMSSDEPSRGSFLRGCASFGVSAGHTSKSAPNRPTPSNALSFSRPSRSQNAWFYDCRFDGHFPSRILPFVYLGNLNHASNALMLKALGITHVVSMGESALIPQQHSRLSSSFVTNSQSNVVNSLWHECATGQIDVLDMKGVADDGIDSIRPYIERAMAFIEKCREAGGKVLVHCRVGVSRSATVVIGYVMKYLQMDLASAYLMVRSRRLNILIQPNLLFMWGLKRLESDLVAQSQPSKNAGNDCAINNLELRKRRIISWSYLSRDIADLNHRYLC